MKNIKSIKNIKLSLIATMPTVIKAKTKFALSCARFNANTHQTPFFSFEKRNCSPYNILLNFVKNHVAKK